MKKLLALVLALVMTMSLVTISNAAFKDADKIDNKEAVDVMAAVGVLAGYDNGNFGAKDTLTRAQAAKIIAYLDLGGKTADAIKGTGTVFTDVKASDWFAGFVEYCAGAGYVAGVGDKKFAPNEKVTGVQFAKMLLCALGYSAEIEGYTGADYTIAIARDANKNDLYKDLSIAASADLTREQAAQMAFNALQATCVEYKGGTNVSTSDGTKVVINAERSEVTNNKGDYRDDDTDTVQQLCEKLYSGSKGLKLVTLVKNLTKDGDDFGRPADHKWTYDGDDAYVAVKEATFTYTAETSAKDMLKDLKGYKLADDTKIAEEADVKTAFASKTANGKVVELYFDDDNTLDTAVGTKGVIEIAYSIDQISSITTNKSGDVTYILDAGTFYDYADNTAKDDTVVLAGEVDEDDYVTVVVANKVAYIYPTTKVVGAQSQTDGKSITVSGTKYELGLGVNTVKADEFSNSKDDANYYLDQFGFVVKTDAIASTDDYAVVTGIQAKEDLGTKTAQAKLVFADGTEKTVDISKINGIKASKFDIVSGKDNTQIYVVNKDVKGIKLSNTSSENAKFEGQIVTYSEKDGKYSLTFVNLDLTKKATEVKNATVFTKGVAVSSDKKLSSDNATQFVVKDKDGDYTAYTGYKALPTIKAGTDAVTYIAYVKDDIAKFVYIDAEKSDTIGDSKTSDLFYGIGKDVVTIGVDDDKYYTVVGILNGEEATIKSEDKATLDKITETMFELTVDGDGYVTAVKDMTSSVAKVTKAFKNDVIAIGGTAYSFADNAVVYVIDDGEVSTGTVNSAKKDDSAYVVVVDDKATDADATTIKTLYVIK